MLMRYFQKDPCTYSRTLCVALSFEHRDWTSSLGPQSLSSSCFLQPRVALCCSFDDCLQILSIGRILPRPLLHTHICSAEFSCPHLSLSVHTPASERTALALSPRQDDQELTAHQGLPLAVHGDDWRACLSSRAVLLHPLSPLLPSQLLVFHVFVVLGTVVFHNSAGWHYMVLCCEKSNSVFAPSQASGFSQESFSCYGKWYCSLHYC